MSESEYIIWKSDTLEAIQLEHPNWNHKQVTLYFSAIKAKLESSGTVFPRPF